MSTCRTARRILAVSVVGVAGACSDTSQPTAILVPPAPSMIAMPANTVTVTIEGQAYSLDTLGRRMYVGNEVITLDLEMSKAVLTDIRGIEVADRDVEQLEAAYYERNGECIITNSCLEPMALPEGGGDDGFISVWRGTVPGSARKPIIRRRRLEPPPTTDGPISTLATADFCMNTVTEALSQSAEYRQHRGRFLKAIVTAAVAYAAGSVVEKAVPFAAAASLYGVAAEASFEYIDVAVLSWLWYSQGCNTRDYWVGNAADNRVRPSSRVTTTVGGVSGTYVWDCHWERWDISVDHGRTFTPVNVRVCAYELVE